MSKYLNTRHYLIISSKFSIGFFFEKNSLILLYGILLSNSEAEWNSLSDQLREMYRYISS